MLGSGAIRLAVAAMLVLGQALAFLPGEALAQESLKQLTDTTTGYYYTHPSISADGARIAFWSEGLQEIYVINSDGAGLRRLVGGALRPQGPPSISADGQWIAFHGGLEWGDIYLMRTDGTGLMELTPALTGDSEQDQYIVGGRGSPVISGDGSLVVFSSNANFTGWRTLHWFSSP